MSDDLAHLLAVQDLDTTITQLEHRRAALVESSGLAAAAGQLASLQAALDDAEARRAVLTSTQKDLEAQIAVIVERGSLLEKRMYASTSSSARDLQAMNEEVRHLTERRAELEELELVAMLEQDPIDAELATLRERTVPLEAQVADLRRQVTDSEGEIDGALREATGSRAAAAALLPAGLSQRYEALRTRLKGTGAARLVGSHCDGCHLELSSVEVEKIRALPPGEVATCEQCGRILVPA